MRTLIILTLLFFSHSSFSETPGPDVKLHFDQIPVFPNVFRIYGIDLYLKDSTLFLSRNGNETKIVSREKGIGQDGKDIAFIELWGNGKIDEFAILGVVTRWWYQSASDFGEEYSLIPVLIQHPSLNKSEKGVIVLSEIQPALIYSVTRKLGDEEIDIIVNSGKNCNNNLKNSLCYSSWYTVNTKSRELIKNKGENADISPSFSCLTKLSNIELIICQSLALSSLDKLMAAIYRENTSASKKTTQQQWLKERNVCIYKVDWHDCLIRAYDKRIEELQNNR